MSPQVGARLGEVLFIMGVFVAPQVGARLGELLFIMSVFVAPQIGARLGVMMFIMGVFPRSSASKVTFSRLMTHTHTYIYIYMCVCVSYRTANLQMLHFIYLFNKYTY